MYTPKVDRARKDEIMNDRIITLLKAAVIHRSGTCFMKDFVPVTLFIIWTIPDWALKNYKDDSYILYLRIIPFQNQDLKIFFIFFNITGFYCQE